MRRARPDPDHRRTGMRSGGFAMAVVLALVTIMALLSVASVQDVLTGRTLATTRLYHQRAFALAELGAATALAQLRTGATPSSTPQLLHPVPSPTDSALVTVRSLATNGLPAGYSAGRFVEHHLEISSIGRSARGTRVAQVQGLKRTEPMDSARTHP